MARQKVGTPRPTIHLRTPDDKAFADGANRITRTGVLVVLAGHFTAGPPLTGDTWEVSTNSGADYNHTLIKLPLERPDVRVRLTREGSYTDNQVRARQTISRVRSPFAGLAAFIYDATPPVITLTGDARIVLDVGETYTDQGATAADKLDDNVQNNLVVDSSAVDTTTTGTYTVTYSATDHAGNVGTATREVVVRGQAANRNPLANAGLDQGVDTGAEVTLNGAVSSDPDTGDTLSYAWTHTLTDGNPPTTAITLTDTVRPTFTAPATAATLTFSLIVTDDDDAASPADTVTITVTVPNQRPVTNAGPDQPNAVVNREVTLSGSGDDPDGDNSALIYFWGQASGPDVDLSNDGVARPTFTPAKAGIYTFDLTVIDDGGVVRGTTDTVVITVSAATTDSTAPVLTFDRFEHTGGEVVATTTFLNEGDTLTAFVNSDEALAATSLVDAAFFDFDGSVRSAQDLRPVVGVANQYSATYTIKPEDNDAGPRFNVRGVMDTADPANTTDNFRHSLGTVTIDNSAPVITLNGDSSVAVAPGGTYTEAEDAGISGAGRDDTTAMTTTGPDAVTVNGIAVDTDTAGEYRITYIVTDLAGNVSNTLTRTVTVGEPPVPNTAPTANAGPDQAVDTGEEVTLDGSGSSDSETAKGDLIYFWSQAEGPDVDLSNDRAVSTTFTPPGAGTYIFDLTVTDTGNPPMLTTDKVIITVAAATTDTTAPVITFDRFEHTGGVVVATTTFLNVGDTLTAFVNSDEPLAAVSLVDAAFFDFDGSARATQNLLPVVGVTNQYRATYTITTADDDAGPQFNVRGVMDTADPAHTTDDFRHSLGTVTIDTVAPTITLLGNSPVAVAHGGDYTDMGVSGVRGGETLATVITGPDGATALDTDTAGDYLYTYTATDRAGNVSNTLTRAVTVGEAPPVVTPPPTPIMVAENTATVHTFIATTTATDGRTVASFALGGADAGDFSITNAGVLTFDPAPNFEAPTDANTDNDYEITVTATDNGTPTETSAAVTVTVSVANVDEAGTATIAGIAQVGVVLTASVTDPDGAVTAPQYEWRSAAGAVSAPRDIATYTPDADDVGRTLWVTVIYSDPVYGNKRVMSNPTAAVLAAPDTTAPMVTIPALGESTVGNRASVEITFDEAVSGLTSGDFTADNAMMIGVNPDSGANTIYTVTYTPSMAGAVRLTLAANSVDDTAATPNTGPASPVTANGNAAVAATEDTTKPRITAQMTIAGLTTAEFDADKFLMGMARFLNVPSDDVNILSIAAASVIVEYEVVTTADQLDALAATLSGAGASQLRTASGQTLPGGAAVTNTAPQTSQPPVANAGLDQRNVDTGAMVTLDGSGSTGDELEYAWVQDTGATVTLSSITAVMPTFTAPAQANDLVFTLTVTDRDGGSATDTVRIFVTASTAFRIALAVDTGIDGDGITSNGLVNVMNPGVGWSYTTNGGTTSTVGTGTTSFTLPEGAYDANDVVASQVGEDVETAELGAVTVDSTDPTVVTFDNIAAGVIGTPQEHAITFSEALDFVSADITAEGATVNRVTSNDGIIHSINFTPTEAAFSLTLDVDSVMDLAGNTGPAEEASASGSANQPPTAEAGPPQTEVAGTEVTLAGSGNDPDGNNDDLTYSWALTGGTGITLSDANIAAPTFTPTAAGTYTFTLTVTDADTPEGSATDTVIITVTANTAPAISGDATPNFAENADTPVETYTATDAEGNAIIWSITGGTDAALFSIAPNNAAPNKGELTFNNPPDFENDTHTETYEVTITATETNGVPSNLASAPLAVTVTVTNVEEPGAIGDITGTARVSVELTAGTVTDADSPDGVEVGTITYQWQSAPGDTTDHAIGSAAYGAIASATNSTYTPAPADEGRLIRVVATYTDGHGSGKEATSNPTAAVQAATPTKPVVAPPTTTPIVFAENDTATVHPFTATPTGTRTIVSYALGGADAGAFSITDAGVLTFSTPPDFEAEADANNDNDYEITITATDSESEASDALTVTVRVANAEDAGSVSAISGTAQVGETLTAGTVVTDQDSVGAISITGYQWRRLPSGGGPVNIGTDQVTYDVVVADLGATLHVVVSYTDDFGGDTDTATSNPTGAVQAAGVTPMPTIALAMDTGTNTSDGITSNGLVNVSGVTDGATWKHTIKGTTSAALASTVTSFTLPEGVYLTSEVQVVQTANSVDSAPATFDRQITVDSTAPTVTFGTITAGEIDAAQDHDITFSEDVTGLEVSDFSASNNIVASGDLVVNSVTPASGPSGPSTTYTISITPRATAFSLTLAADSVMDIAGNDGPVAEAIASGGTATPDGTTGTGPPTPANRNPVAEAGPAQRVDTNALVTLNGSGNDPDGDNNALTYSWELTGGTGITLSNANIAGPTFTPVAAGTYTFSLTVTDAGTPSASATDTVTITVTVPANRLPVADAGPAQRVETNALVTLNGTGSSDPDGDTLSYAWTHTQTGGAAPATPITLTGADTAGPTFTPVAAGTYTFTLTVTDDGTPAASDTDTVTITVTVPANQPPVAEAGPAQSVETNALVTLNGSGSSDPDGDTLSYAWTHTQTGGSAPATPITLTGANTAGPTFTPVAAGTYTFTLTVTDDADAPASDTDTVAVTVTRPRDTVAPVITLRGDSPLEVNQGATYTDPGATASDDTDGDLDSAGIIVGGDTVDTDTIGAYSVTYDVSDAAGNAAATVTRIVRVVVARDLAALNEAILPEVARDIADRNVSAIARRIEQARLPSRVGSSASLGGASSLAEIATSQGSTVADGRFDLQRLLNNSNFVLPLNATGAGAADGGTQLTLWGAGDYRDLKGADGVRWSGDLFSLQLGLDAHLNERTILGVSVSGSKVELDYTNPSAAAGGNYDLDMTSVHPYLGWSAGSLDFWATLGYGEGELEISADGGAQADSASSDLSMQTLGLGANGVLMATGTTTVLLKTEALSTQLEVDASEEITAITQQAHRVRMTLEAIRGHSLDSGARLETSLEAGLRYDGGDGETGAGAELGGGLRYANHSGGLVIEGRARALVGGKGDTEEWGLSGLIKLSPAANGRGLSFSLTPGYGVTTSGVERLWQQGLDDGLEAQGGTDGNNYTPNLDLRLDYGMDVSAMPGLVTPYTEFSFGATGDTYRLGLQWQRSKWFDLKLVAERAAGQITADHRIYIEGELAF